MVATYTDTKLRSPIYNIMTLSIFKSLLDVADDEFYIVDPEFQGNSILVTNEYGDVEEGLLGNNISVSNGKLRTNCYYGTCATAASTQIKIVDCPDFVLREGADLVVKFTNAQTYNGQPKLNVNNTGAIGICKNGTTAAARYSWYTGEAVHFIYDGTNWVLVDGFAATTSYSGITTLSATATSTSTSVAATPSTVNIISQNLITGAPIFSASSTYNVGDYVRYGSTSPFLYKCITAIPTGHAWDATEWEQLPDLFTMIQAITPQVATITDTSSIDLTNNTTYTAGELTSFTITMPSTPDATFNAEIAFASGTTATTITYSEPINWLDGSDSIVYVSNVPVFTPAASSKYNVWIWYDGTQWNGLSKVV